jgi:L-ascorbate metabolism protein UlaG (beta-lactamase superfamily)
MRSRVWIVVAVALSAAMVLAQPGGSGPDPVVAARNKLLGPGWNDPTQVRVRWFGVTNFVASFGGHVVLLDAWVIQGTIANYVPTTVADLIAADPEYIYIGHGHFDHAAHAGVIAEATGAKIVGTAEHCAGAKEDATDPEKVHCVSIVDKYGNEFHGGSSQPPAPFYAPPMPFGTVGHPKEGPPGLTVTAVMGRHSAPRPPDPTAPRTPVGIPNGPPAILQYPPSPTDFAHEASSQGDDEGGSVIYRFQLGEFVLVWHDTVGPLSNPGEDGAEAIGAGISSLGPADLEIGAVQGFNQITNGLKDVRRYVESIRPKVFMPAHHDNWLPPNATTGEAYYEPLVAELELIPFPSRPKLCFIADRESYLAPFVFKTTEWSGPYAGAIDGCWTPA